MRTERCISSAICLSVLPVAACNAVSSSAGVSWARAPTAADERGDGAFAAREKPGARLLHRCSFPAGAVTSELDGRFAQSLGRVEERTEILELGGRRGKCLTVPVGAAAA